MIWCGYADHLLLVFNDERSLNKGISLLNDIFKRLLLRINANKTNKIILKLNLMNPAMEPQSKFYSLSRNLLNIKNKSKDKSNNAEFPSP